jgi:hypothetical protein
MSMLFFERLFKWLFIVSLVLVGFTYFQKDLLPGPENYDQKRFVAPKQTPTTASPFGLSVNGQQYRIEPVYAYELEGMVVSYHDADSFSDIWHHDKWKDFLNVRDLCVVWGGNLTSGVYQEMEFSNDSWTCWAYWPNSDVGSRFSMSELSNNHLLTDDLEIKHRLMSAETGDHIRLRGYLASYENPANNFKRGTSTTRTDTGNGACETVYLTAFDIVSKANNKARGLFDFAKWLALVSFVGFVLFFIISPVRRPGLR